MGTTTVPILPVKLGFGAVHFAQAVRAGRWLFVSGLMAQDFKTGIRDSVLSSAMPHFASSPEQREAHAILDSLDAILGAGGTSRENVVRLDQFFTGLNAIPSYQEARRGRFGNVAPASTSMLVEALPLLQAKVQIDALAAIVTPDFQPRSVAKPNVSSISGPSPSVTVGDFVFISGQLATADPGAPLRDGMPVEACVPATTFWGGQTIRTETEYVLHKRLRPALERAKSSFGNVLKAQVYLTHIGDLQAFRQVWAECFDKFMPATTIIVAPEKSTGIAAARVEINVIALSDDAKEIRKEVIEADVTPAYAEFPAAVRAGDLLFFSGLMANDANGVVAAAHVDRMQPLYGSAAEAQADCIWAKAGTICAAAGTSLTNIVRAQQFHTNLSEFYPAHCAWKSRRGEQPLPFAAIGLPGPMSIPGCSILMDLWAYVPQERQPN